MALLAKGEIDYGLTFVSEIITEPGVEAVGPLPRDISTPTFLSAFLSADSKNAEAAKALISYLSSPEAAAVYKARGMLPGKWSAAPPRRAPGAGSSRRIHTMLTASPKTWVPATRARSLRILSVLALRFVRPPDTAATPPSDPTARRGSGNSGASGRCR